MNNEVKTSIDGIEVGMYISRLDKPWINTPFKLEGMMIKTQADIEELRKYCTHAYVDVERGESPDPRFWILKKKKKTHITKQADIDDDLNEALEKNEFTAIRTKAYVNTTSFENEFGSAKSAYEKLGNSFKDIVDGLKKGKDLDLDLVKDGITDMVESIIHNPSAMMWIAQLRKLDDYAYGRSLGTSVWCGTFGRHLGLERDMIEQLSLGGLLLDIGKTTFPPELLKKPGHLTKDEINLIKQHVDRGVKLLAKAMSSVSKKVPMDVLQMVASHHERADGSGYPLGIDNAEIPLYGKIAGIIDSYDAMTSDRPFLELKAMTPHEAITELYALRGKRFQEELVEQFIQAVGLYPTGSLVELSTGEIGAVVAINGLRRLRPSIMLLLDENKKPLPNFKHINLSQMDESILVDRALPPGSYGIKMDELFL